MIEFSCRDKEVKVVRVVCLLVWWVERMVPATSATSPKGRENSPITQAQPGIPTRHLNQRLLLRTTEPNFLGAKTKSQKKIEIPQNLQTSISAATTTKKTAKKMSCDLTRGRFFGRQRCYFERVTLASRVDLILTTWNLLISNWVVVKRLAIGPLGQLYWLMKDRGIL